MKYGCIGEHLAHSFSKEIHRRIGSYRYDLREVEREKLPEFMTEHDFHAINVTVPYKVDVLPFLDEIDEKAQKIGAVNTIVNRGGRLSGYNTDFEGMTALIHRLGLELGGKEVLILGTGGTSRTASAVARSLGAAHVVRVSRTPGGDSISYEEACTAHSEAQIILNTTPCGMYPRIEGCPIAVKKFPNLEGVVDVIYNPLRSRLVQAAQERGIRAGGGLYMLVAQAVFAAEKFFDRSYDPAFIDTVYTGILREKENLVLTGMPGSGKSTVGKMLARELQKEFLDTDRLIAEKFGNPPDVLIRTNGIERFRQMESEVIREISTRNNCVIATGGGAVLDGENVVHLKMNGTVFLLDRPLEQLVPTGDRPLSSDREKLERLYHERASRYQQTCDKRIDNSTGAEAAVQKILHWNEGQRL